MPVEFTCLVTIDFVFKQTITKQTKVYFFRPLIFRFVVFVSFCLWVGVSCPSAAFTGKRNARHAHEKTRMKTLCAIRVIGGKKSADQLTERTAKRERDVSRPSHRATARQATPLDMTKELTGNRGTPRHIQSLVCFCDDVIDDRV